MTFEERIKEYVENDVKAANELYEAYEKEKTEREYKKLRLSTMYGIFALPDDSELKQELIKECAERIAKVLLSHKAVYGTGGLHLAPEDRIKKLQELNENLFSKVAELNCEKNILEKRLSAVHSFEQTIEELREEVQERNEKVAELYAENQKLKDMIARMRANITVALNTPYNEERGGYDE